MRSIAIIAGGVFRDSIRDRIGYGLVFFSILLMAAFSFPSSGGDACSRSLISCMISRFTL